MTTDPAETIVDGSGRSMSRRRAEARRCPRCDGEKRVASSGFGAPHPVCARCGYDFQGDRLQPEEVTDGR